MAQKTFTAQGNAQIDTAQFKYGVASGLFDGTGDYLRSGDDADFNFSNQDFSVETFARFAGTSGASVFFAQYISTDRSITTYWNTDNTLHFGYSTDGTTSLDFGRSWTPALNTWYHLAWCRSGTAVRLFVDGAQLGADISISTDTIHNSAGTVTVAADDAGTNAFNGWLDEFRITKGIARYTSSFTPPTGATSYYSLDVLRLHFEGADASTTFTDSSADTTDAVASGQLLIGEI